MQRDADKSTQATRNVEYNFVVTVLIYLDVVFRRHVQFRGRC